MRDTAVQALATLLCRMSSGRWFWDPLDQIIKELDRGSISSSPRYGVSTPYGLTIRNSARLFHHVLFNMGDLHVVLPALKLSNMNAGILIMMQQVRLMMFSLNTVDYSMSFLLLSTQNFFCWTSGGDHSEPFLLFEIYCGTPPSCLKVITVSYGDRYFFRNCAPKGTMDP